MTKTIDDIANEIKAEVSFPDGIGIEVDLENDGIIVSNGVIGFGVTRAEIEDGHHILRVKKALPILEMAIEQNRMFPL